MIDKSERITTPFPDDLVSNNKKNTLEFALEVSKAIESHWFGGQLTQRRLWIDLMRSYSRGEQSTQQYKDTIEGKKDEKSGSDGAIGVKTHKIDYKQLKVLSSFRDIVINPIDESLFKPKAEAIDITAQKEKRKAFKEMDKRFFLKEFNEIIQRATGVQTEAKATPKNIKELNILKSEYKPDIEIAQELAIENVMKKERFEAVKDKINEDLFDLGHGVARHYTDYNEGIKLKYVDPYNWIFSPFQYDDGRDIRYSGVIEKDTIVNIEKQAGRKFTKTELQKLKNL